MGNLGWQCGIAGRQFWEPFLMQGEERISVCRERGTDESMPFRRFGSREFAPDIGGFTRCQKGSEPIEEGRPCWGSRPFGTRREEVDATCLTGPGNPGSIDCDAHHG